MTKKGQKIIPGSLKGGKSKPSAKSKPGSGKRFASLEKKLAKEEGIDNPGALAAALGRAKFGAKKMSKMASAAKKKKK